MALTKTPIELSSTPGIVDNSNDTAITIDSSENVGIGGTTTTGWANKQLVLDAGASASAAFVMVNDTTGRAGTDGSVITLSGSDMYLIQRESANMIFRTANTERLRIDSAGNILFGSNGQGYISGTVANTYNSGYNQDDDSWATWMNYYGYQGGTTRYRDFIVGDGKNGKIATFDGSTGLVGIGTSSPTAKVTVSGTGVGAAIDWTNTTASTGRSYRWVSLNNGTGFALEDLTASSERLRITSAGNLLVGKTNAGDYVTGIEMQPAGAILSYRTSGVASIFGRTDSGEITRFTRGGAIIGSIDVDATGYIAINARTGTGRLQVGGVTRYNWDANQFYPQQDNVRDLGYPNLRWDDVYSTGGINTSDRNEKQDIEELSNAEQRVAVACKGLMRKFRWKSAVIDKGDDARIHVGIMAQDLQAAFESEGLDPARYGMWCSNTWTDEETSEEITRMSVRYNELLAFIISAI